ncbi:hypothetical protein ADL22_00835 [Streptomyces sp. NRRL F-4489]|uniref:hypothetical protein n=1 Tax=Streptomyces sp. NRRL F-4489 TaxID=1609095 RepID=UPI00074B1A16|nr:hypothetical protein [Streptomyces sp. NRRL F-4489]KUL55471.1 hypothetical protein ADL22_00835 [Streptomyces sp. NRRL F-4489]
MPLFGRKPRPRPAPVPAPGAPREDVFAGGPEAVRPLLLPRLRRLDQLPRREDYAIRELGGGFLAVLGARTPSGTALLPAARVRAWDADPAELWSVALHNLRREPCEVTVFQPGTGPVYQVRGGAWTATQLLRAAELLDVTAPDGCVAALPRDDLLVLHPLRDAHSYLRILSLATLLPRLCGPDGGLSDGLFHWRGGVLAPFRVIDQQEPDGRLVHTIQGDAELATVLRRLGDTFRPADEDGTGD